MFTSAPASAAGSSSTGAPTAARPAPPARSVTRSSGSTTSVPPAKKAFPQPGSLESLAAGHVLDRLAREAASAHPDSALGRSSPNGRGRGPDAVTAAMAEDDAVALDVLHTLGRRLGDRRCERDQHLRPRGRRDRRWRIVSGRPAGRAGASIVASEYVLDGVGTADRDPRCPVRTAGRASAAPRCSRAANLKPVRTEK
jgi:hypothetical protein